MDEYFNILIVLMLFLADFAIVHFIRIKGAHPEVSRKTLHLLAGGICLCFPLFFSTRMPVILLGLISSATILFLKKGALFKRGIGLVLAGENRKSFGDLYFPLSVIFIWTLFSNQPLFYTSIIMVLTISDSAAALVGTFLGKNKYILFSGRKSIEGNIACFISAFIIIFYFLLYTYSFFTALTATILIALSVTLAETLSTKGLDNITIPLTMALIFISDVQIEHQSITALSLVFFYTLILLFDIALTQKIGESQKGV